VNPMYLLVAILCSCRYTSSMNPIIYIYMSIVVLFYISLFQIRALKTYVDTNSFLHFTLPNSCAPNICRY
jgi:hypothetical protein